MIVGVAGRTVLVSRHGGERDVEENTTPLRTADGRHIGVVVVLTDIAEPRRHRRERHPQSFESSRFPRRVAGVALPRVLALGARFSHLE